MVGAAQLHELVLAEPELTPVRTEGLRDEVEREGVVAGRHRRVHGEHRVRRDRLACLIERHPLGHQFAAALERHEGRVPLVHVP